MHSLAGGQKTRTKPSAGTPPYADGFPHSAFALARLSSSSVVTYHDLNVEVRGPDEGPSLLLLHGWGSSLKAMRPLAARLSDTYQCHLIDLPGHGASPPPSTPWGVPEHASLLRAYIRDEGTAPVPLIGHSNGGRIGLFMAATVPCAAALSHLVLISPSGVEPERSWRQQMRSRMATALKAPFRALPAPLHGPALDWLRHSLVWRMLGSSDYNALSGVMRETFVKTVNRHLDGVLDRISVPTLVFWGTDDSAVSRRQMAVLEDRIDDCGVVELDGAGHYGHLDDVSTVAAGTRHFLEQAYPVAPSA